jgi:anti-sigma regulatory factor (Ser/Thr protein kinase)
LRCARAGHHWVIAENLELWLAPTATAPARARAAVSDWLGRHGGDRVVEVALLLVSELVTNAVRHASISAQEAVRLHGWLDDSVIRLAVQDGGTEGAVARRGRDLDDPSGGFGLELVDRLSSSWGVERDELGTMVWVELPTRQA